MILFIFGDSITQGYWDDKGGWADRVKASVLAKDIAHDFSSYHGVYNLGVDGNTTWQVVDRFENEIQARLSSEAEYGIIFAVGTNDTFHRDQQGFVSTPEIYKKGLATLSQKASTLTSRIAFVSLYPVDESLTNPLPASRSGKCYTNERIDLFNETLKKHCGATNMILIDVHDKFKKQHNLLADGLHPNSIGHQVIADTIQPVIDQWLYNE